MNTVPGFADEFVTRHDEQRYLLSWATPTGCWVA